MDQPQPQQEPRTALAIVPRIIDLELTNACPADCDMCPREVLPKLGVMKPEIFARLLEDLAGAPTLHWISLCGIGEPLLHPHVVEWARALVKLPSGPKVGLVTAGEKLTPDVYAALIDAGISQIEVSIQAVDRALYAKLMPGLNFDKVMANLEYVASHRDPAVGFQLSYTRHLLNAGHTDEMRRFAARLKVPIGMTWIHTRGGNLARPHLLGLGPRKISTSYACRIFEKIAFVAWDGRVQYCCHDVERAHVVGELGSERLAQINARKTEIVARHGGPQAPICAHCDDPLRERL